VPNHGTRVFVTGEVDMVGGVGYNPARWPGGRKPPGLDLRIIVTDLAVLDFQGPEHAIRVASLHPGVSFEQVQENTGFPLIRPDRLPVTAAPTAEQLDLIRRRLDPQDLRAGVFKGNPPGDRAARP
jgi:glutaconate CoA-transferase subunit B